MSSGAHPSYALSQFREDEVLVKDCLAGAESAWSELVDKYKNLIFSIPIKQGFSQDDATEIFQAVALTLLQELATLREPRALAAWLIRLTVHKCIRWKNERRVFVDMEIDENSLIETEHLPDGLLGEIQREQIVREAVREASPECKRLIDLLFFQTRLFATTKRLRRSDLPKVLLALPACGVSRSFGRLSKRKVSTCKIPKTDG